MDQPPALRDGAVPIEMRAIGEDAEGPCRYQMRRAGDPWPEEWSSTQDLANLCGTYGFDVKWELVGECVRDWVRGVTKELPSESEALAAFRKAGKERLVFVPGYLAPGSGS